MKNTRGFSPCQMVDVEDVAVDVIQVQVDQPEQPGPVMVPPELDGKRQQ